VKQFSHCADLYLNKFEAAVIAHDARTLRQLASRRDAPFPPAPWSYGTYTAATAGQVEDHLPEGRMALYSREFTWVPLEMQFQGKLYDELTTAMTARLDLPSTPETLQSQVASIELLISDERGRLEIANAMLDYSHDNLAVVPSKPAYIAGNAADAKTCEAHIVAIQPSEKSGGSGAGSVSH
jgi:hypothetical protein